MIDPPFSLASAVNHLVKHRATTPRIRNVDGDIHVSDLAYTKGLECQRYLTFLRREDPRKEPEVGDSGYALSVAENKYRTFLMGEIVEHGAIEVLIESIRKYPSDPKVHLLRIDSQYPVYDDEARITGSIDIYMEGFVKNREGEWVYWDMVVDVKSTSKTQDEKRAVGNPALGKRKAESNYQRQVTLYQTMLNRPPGVLLFFSKQHPHYISESIVDPNKRFLPLQKKRIKEIDKLPPDEPGIASVGSHCKECPYLEACREEEEKLNG